MPSVRKRVGANQEVKFARWSKLCLNSFNRQNGIAFLRTFFHPGRHKAFVKSAGNFHHAETMLEACTHATSLMRRIGRRDKQYTVQMELFYGFARQFQMS